MLNCTVDLKWARKDALNPKSYHPVFVRVLKKLIIFDLLEPESSFEEGSPFMELKISSFLSISKPKKYVFHPILVTYTL